MWLKHKQEYHIRCFYLYVCSVINSLEKIHETYVMYRQKKKEKNPFFKTTKTVVIVTTNVFLWVRCCKYCHFLHAHVSALSGNLPLHKLLRSAFTHMVVSSGCVL